MVLCDRSAAPTDFLLVTRARKLALGLALSAAPQLGKRIPGILFRLYSATDFWPSSRAW